MRQPANTIPAQIYPKKSTYPDLKFTSVVELLRYRAIHQTQQRAFTFLTEGETGETHLTYGELDRQARVIGGWLQSRGVTGERVLLLYPPGLDYISAFFGCLYAGCVAVPAYPPRLNRPDLRLQAIVSDTQAAVAFTNHQILGKLAYRWQNNATLAALQWLDTNTILTDSTDIWQEPTINGETLAFLQYTSGSTTIPKGVKVSHNNLLHNQQIIQTAFQNTPHSVLVGWLPFYHDMGLIGNVLQPLYVGFPGILMSPMAFLQKPVRWLQAISHYKATVSGGPNFAYDFCVDRIPPQEREQLDLSSWQIAFNGAEFVRSRTLERFLTTFEPYGFQAKAFFPCYGLAEATLMVTGGPAETTPVLRAVQLDNFNYNHVITVSLDETEKRPLVGCGQTWLDQKVLIVDPETLVQCSPGQIGEVWVAGPSVAQGYWNRPEETRHSFQAYLANSGQGPFLRTGDLGFLENGELFITGRLKDLIIVRGRNYYPQDIELVAEQSHPALRPNCGAAFSVEVNSEERLTVVFEVERSYREIDVEEVARAVREAVAKEFELQVYAVVLIKTGHLAKTSSGKIQRHFNRKKFLTNDLDIVGLSILDDAYAYIENSQVPGWTDGLKPPKTSTEVILAQIWRDVLQIQTVGIDQNFFALGGHSLLATQLMSRIRETFLIDLPLHTIFEVPTIAGLAGCIDTQEKQIAPVPLIEPISRQEVLPLSFSQERMWFLYQFEPNNIAYHVPIAIRLTGQLDIAVLERSISEVIQRHEILRTTFPNVNGRPVQAVTQKPVMTIPFVDMQLYPLAERDIETRRKIVTEAQRPFDMAQGPLMRITLFQVEADEYVVLVVMHHIISDAWSLSLLWQEIATLYTAFLAGKDSPLPEMSIQYADFANWQRRWLTGEKLAAQLAYWQQTLATAPYVLDLPTDRPRPPIQSSPGAYQSVPLSLALLESLRELGRQEDATLFMTLLAAFKILLYRYTGQPDILVGTPIANRHWLAIEGLIGTFVNTLVLRTDLSGNPTFRELLQQVRQVALAAFDHQDLPFEQLVEVLQPDRNLSHTPLIQVMFSMANPPMPMVQLPNLTWNLFEFDRGAAQFDLTLSIVDTRQIQMMSVEYNTDLFDHTTIKRMVTHLQVLLESIVATDGRQHLLDLPLLPESQRRQQLVVWNDTRMEFSQELCIHQLFEVQVKQTPQAVAVVFGDEQLTYDKLNQRANLLAHHLQTLRVGPGVNVAICLERSIEMLVALLGVLKAGGTFVPLDPAYPQQRLTFMLEDSNAQVLLTQQHLLNKFPDNAASIVSLNADWDMIARNSDQNLDIVVSPQVLAYIIYTSGSTGTPKGVEISHGAVVNFLLAMQVRPGLTSQDILLAITTLSFDIAVLELFLPLVTGATVVIANRDEAMDGPKLIERLVACKATVMQATPATWRLLLQAGWTGSDRLKILCGGEALSHDLAGQLLKKGASVWNMYGPTEATVWATVAQVQDGDGTGMPIGSPIANTQVYVLDTNLQPVPVGVPGQLYIGGEGLARGYRNRPELTAEKFVANPFSDEPNQRLYQTGDMVRYRPNGELEYLGRLDHQVKLRGFRIELGEIEAVLAQHPALREVVVIAREDILGDKRLVAYLVPKREIVPITGELRQFLQKKLPDYMVPGTYVILDTLPLTPNGKINRQALPAPDQTSLKRNNIFAAPRDALEVKLVEIWEEILTIQPISISDNFFDMGGHSLLAVQLFARLETMLGRSLPVSILFQAPTIQQLAQILRREGWTAPFSSLVAIQPQGDRPPFFCVHGMGGGILGYADLAYSLGLDQPFYGLQERAMSGPYEPFTSIEAMAAHYLQEVRTLQPEGPYFLGGYCFGGTVAFEMARQLHAQAQRVALLAIIDNAPPNSGYYEPIWKPGVFLKFLRNLPYWLHDFRQLRTREMVARIMRKLRVVAQEITRQFRPPAAEPSRTDIEAIIDDDFSHLPVENQRYLKAHYLALVNYTPQPYAGRITLFRTRRYSLLGPFDPHMGWDKLAGEAVDVKEITGFHANILQSPYVQQLADQLRLSLSEAEGL